MYINSFVEKHHVLYILNLNFSIKIQIYLLNDALVECFDIMSFYEPLFSQRNLYDITLLRIRL